MTVDQWLLFVGVWFVVGLPLGPNALNCIAVSAAKGFGRALWAVLGILAAAVFYIAAVTLGLGAALLANEALFSFLKLSGAAYLIWMGGALILRREPNLDVAPPSLRSRRAIARQAALISLSNPKAMISYGAVFSQFVSPDRDAVAQLAVLAPTALAIVAVIYIGYSAAGLGVKRVLASAARRRWFDRGVGGFYIFAGVTLVASEASTLRSTRA